MKTILLYALAVAVMTLGAYPALAQPVNGCPAGQAMQSSDPSGHKITCVPVGGGEADIIGQWAVTGSTNCLQSSAGFNPQSFTPVIPTAGVTTVANSAGTFIGTRTFYAGGSGRMVGVSHNVLLPATNYGATFSGPGGAGGTSTASLDASFTWSIRADGTLLMDDDSTVPQPFTSPPLFLGQTATIENVPSYVGYVSKDKRTIVMTHPGMAIETSIRRDASGAELSRSPRYCVRSRVMTRLP